MHAPTTEVDARPVAWIGRCPGLDCPVTARLELPPDQSPPPVVCRHCSVRLGWEPVAGTTTETDCDPRCWDARGHECRCSCGGVNHGATYQGVIQTGENGRQYVEMNTEERAAEMGKRATDRARRLAPDLPEILGVLREKAETGHRFSASIIGQWDAKGSLTDNQIVAARRVMSGDPVLDRARGARYFAQPGAIIAGQPDRGARGAGFDPTDEQRHVLELAATGEDLVIEAGAGCGKTATLVLLATMAPDRLMTYTAFNRKIVEEARRKMPTNCQARTMHSLAMEAVGRPFSGRIRGSRMSSTKLAQLLGVDPLVVPFGTQRKVVQPATLASLAMRTIWQFCNSADPEPTRRHVPYLEGIDPQTSDGKRTFANNDKVAEVVEQYLPTIWKDLRDPEGTLPYRPDAYLKLWEQSDPVIAGDVVLFDEAQDASPVMSSIVEQQERSQVIRVGDSAQSIYGWRGAVNALETAEATHRSMLSQSFRFGVSIAEAANAVLSRIEGMQLRLKGLDSIPSKIAPAPRADAVLCRSNALAMETVLNEQESGRRAFLVGNGDELRSFCKAVLDLVTKGSTTHPELCCFTSWQQVLDYVANDPQGDELALMVGLIQDHGAEDILEALDRMPAKEEDADVLVSTAHKAKGLEWSSVRLTEDFRWRGEIPGQLPPEEWRLLYVALTRAQLILDPFDADPLRAVLAGAL